MSAIPGESWGPIGVAVLRWLADPPAADPSTAAVLIALGALVGALGATVYIRLLHASR